MKRAHCHVLSATAAAIAGLLSPCVALADCSAPVAQAFEKLRASKSFRMETQITNAQGKLTMTVDYMPPDRMHQKVRLDDQPQEMELIVIGAQAWSNQGQGWVALPENFSAEVSKQLATTLAGATKVEAVYNCRSDETLDGKTVATYESKLAPPSEEKAGSTSADKAAAPLATANTQTLYVDKTSGLPVRNLVTDGADPNKRLFDGWFRTAVDITIEPPIPTP